MNVPPPPPPPPPLIPPTTVTTVTTVLSVTTVTTVTTVTDITSTIVKYQILLLYTGNFITKFTGQQTDRPTDQPTTGLQELLWAAKYCKVVELVREGLS